jgi:uncharacterized coiled-coil protein SlyX
MAGSPQVVTAQPTDLPTAHRVIAELSEQLHKQQRENQILRDKLDSLCRKLWGRSSEQVSEAQLQLAFAQLGQEPPAAASVEPTQVEEMDSGESVHPGRPRRRHPRGRQALPTHLPRRREVNDLG